MKKFEWDWTVSKNPIAASGCECWIPIMSLSEQLLAPKHNNVNVENNSIIRFFTNVIYASYTLTTTANTCTFNSIFLLTIFNSILLLTLLLKVITFIVINLCVISDFSLEITWFWKWQIVYDLFVSYAESESIYC